MEDPAPRRARLGNGPHKLAQRCAALCARLVDDVACWYAQRVHFSSDANPLSSWTTTDVDFEATQRQSEKSSSSSYFSAEPPSQRVSAETRAVRLACWSKTSIASP
jgi:hypothetical protein